MKYLCHVTAPVITSLAGDNLRGEPRWERNSLDALLSEGRQAHTTFPIWEEGEDPIPKGLQDGYNVDWKEESVLITYGMREKPHITQEAKYYIVNYLDGPTKEQRDSFLKYKQGNSYIVAICNWNSWLYMDRLRDALGAENVKWVPGPFVPDVDESADNFDATYLLWSFRNFYKYATTDPRGMVRLFNQLAGYMQANPKLRLAIVIAQHDPSVLKDVENNKLAWFESLPCYKEVERFKSRIDVLYNLDWYSVLELLKDTKAVIAPPESLGCPAYEAAMFGIPTVMDKENNNFLTAEKKVLIPNILTAPRSICSEWLANLDTLVTDHQAYRKYGDAYRNYVKEHITYKAYVRDIENLIKERGWSFDVE